ncbi:hypothetical protein PTTG_05391 [Puccinia triticina 1-1 BBBD Race 1]|uniref:glucan 1,3-beta-glucosidase n=2 Tax=Puccinia triticina TaxID=208348 RepID=A0A180GY55_PUCT1|nr:uncharacterized protein PtA15_17A253 [Puccinia triticina]OAV97192.1 hypothetical protein PTTG_05391 [Puccinia triticina 1-1 BBBD Race 1]WAQ92771.1 hypothetical protein PtA15_17A253 [Puccinia triticina]WAR63668.1 hypothetical protein PtB15_17B269 [Puccinia triticina]
MAIKRRPWAFIIIGSILAICAVVIPIAVVFTSKSESHPDPAAKGVSAASKAHKIGPNDLAPKPKWDFDVNKIVGINLGNWLILERWMAEDWFVQNAGPNSWDEWSFTIAKGDKAAQTLEEHWATWVTEDDIEKLYQAGINTLRIPLGFWLFIETVPPEPYITTTQLDHLERLCGWAYARDMYIIMDLHGLPGSQNGEQQSGHNTTSPNFFQPLQQARSDQLIKAVVDWIDTSAYYSIISAIEVVNEPRPYTTEQRAMLRAYYDRSYETIQTLGPKAPAMFFADGFVPGDKFAYWWEFASSHKTQPPTLIYTDHPYIGYFPAQTNAADIFNQICTKGTKYANFPVTTVITEWSLRTGIQNTTFERTFYEAQLNTWAWYSGAVFWSLRVLDSKVAVLADKVAQYQWSFENLLERGSIAQPTKKGDTTQFLKELRTPCGAPPTLVRDGTAPQGTAAAAAIADAEAAKAMIPTITKTIEAAAQQFGLVGIGAKAVHKSPKRRIR